MKRFLTIGAVFVFGFVLLGAFAETGQANGCVKTQQRYSMLDFRNTCSYPVTIKVCSKSGLRELGEALGMGQSNWQCRQALTRAGGVGPSITWANQNSSFLGTVASDTRYISGACKQGYQVNIDIGKQTYTCAK